ncbi:2-phospho-L-lactate transferase [Marinomonas pollencensis]|uniref:LPPG:FO 2-phospho-L-lactate transferase n=1 Tax=Marinomonas pollencensis TaxID=491954 RepID=A0A3E0DN66_9GAMM|nr:2-phospho-L-lactate transferase [Marinomonas pollencensis]REG84270.1 LPPG:FO 2-phospho-L-lactate transferase [Marinomonas pollencensis]
MSDLTITLLAGGVGGAKAAEGLAASIYAANTQVIGNIADDEEFHGLWVSPDIDTLIYSLGNQIDRERGWGRKNESYRLLEELSLLGQDTWMTLGDLDLATHIYRTELRKQGVRASHIVQRLAKRYGASLPILLPTDDVVQTQVNTPSGWLSFQQYFVREQCKPEVLEVDYKGANIARATSEALFQIAKSDLIIIAPSNPIVSIGAILATPGIQQAIENSNAYVLAISPLIAGKTVKGPADKMLASMGLSTDSKGIYQGYSSFLDAMVIDEADRGDLPWLHDQGLDVLVTPTLMKTREDKCALLTRAVDFAQQRRKQRAA